MVKLLMSILIINFKKMMYYYKILISSPIEIKAIGSPELLYGSITRPAGYIELLEQTGVIVNVKKSNNITINKYDGIINSQYIKNE